MELIEQFIKEVVDSKLLAAKATYDRIIKYVSACEDTTELGILQAKIEGLSDIIGQLHYRLTEVEAAMTATAAQDELDESWILGLTYLGVTTHYRNNENGSISVRLSGLIDDLSFFEQIAVIHEFDLFKDWFPFCCNSKTITKLGPAELVGYLQTYIAPLGRDVVIRAYGVDCLQEHDKLVLVGSSYDHWPPNDEREVIASAQILDYSRKFKLGTNESSSNSSSSSSSASEPLDCDEDWFQSIVGEPVPWVDIGWFHDRVDIPEFKAVVEVVAPHAAKTIFLITCNPRAKLPQTFINFVIRNLAGMFMHFFQSQVKKVSGDPTCSHSRRIRENPAFYRDWLLPKLRAYCALRGWEQPTILSMGADGAPPEVIKQMELDYARAVSAGTTEDSNPTTTDSVEGSS